jgi:hypothetical protein
VQCDYLSATPGYFAAMDIPLVRGRLFTDADRARSPRVVLISESAAAAFFPGQDPIGKRFKAASCNDNDRRPDGAWRTVIGVVGNVRYRGLHDVPLDMHDPPSQTTAGNTTSLVVRLQPGEARHALATAARCWPHVCCRVGVGLRALPTYGMVIVVVTGVVTCASYWPARRAAQANPLTLLRSD